MPWRMRLDLENDADAAPRRWRVGVVVLVVSVWVVGITVLAAWLAGLVVR